MTYKNNESNEITNKINNEFTMATAKDLVSYIVHEGTVVRMERQIKRLWIALIVAIVAIFACNIAWLYYESQFETISYSQDGEGLNNINTGEQGDLYGADSKNQEKEIGQS